MNKCVAGDAPAVPRSRDVCARLAAPITRPPSLMLIALRRCLRPLLPTTRAVCGGDVAGACLSQVRGCYRKFSITKACEGWLYWDRLSAIRSSCVPGPGTALHRKSQLPQMPDLQCAWLLLLRLCASPKWLSQVGQSLHPSAGRTRHATAICGRQTVAPPLHSRAWK